MVEGERSGREQAAKSGGQVRKKRDGCAVKKPRGCQEKSGEVVESFSSMGRRVAAERRSGLGAIGKGAGKFFSIG